MYTKQQGHDNEGEVIANSDIFLTFNWMGPVEKEVKVYGTLERIGSQEMEHFFQSRDENSAKAAWTSDDSKPISNQDLESKLIPLYGEIKIKDGDPEWEGWRFVPENLMIFTKRMQHDANQSIRIIY